ncbi:hypothetical protein X777_02063 [Ooceraea biroi]|uniref:GIY-YIG domain-containing protein n=1 Tax=Ooceraea biroi TaxID=2015173 RepID=A0A026WR06_OOCBI|nr:hypothetical protein X777_02063 [Ooceraea biroi]
MHKASVVNSLVDRAVLLSDGRFHEENINKVRTILANNCYPQDFISRRITRRLQDIKYRNTVNNGSANSDVRRNSCFITVPYVRGIGETLTRILNSCGISVAYTVPNKLDCFIKRGKDCIANSKKMGVVYRINCSDCNVCYIGQTKRHLEERIKEHRSDIKKDPDCWSVVSQHSASNGHCFDWQNINILHQETHLRKRLLAEMIFIKRHEHTINLQKDTESLPGTYDSILNNILFTS